MMQIRVGFEMTYDCPQPTPMLFNVNVHFTRAEDVFGSNELMTDALLPITAFRDSYGNRGSRVVAPAGRTRFFTDVMVSDPGTADPVVPGAQEFPVELLPDHALQFLLGSRYCETDRLSQAAWDLFGRMPGGWGRVQAICDYVHRHIEFGYEHARNTRTALEVFQEKKGVCRDYTHLAVAFCRCLNIPARYCTGYLSDIGLPPPYAPMDFAAWFEAYLGGRWYVFDPRNNAPRIGRILVARGRDAADVAISTSFGASTMSGFLVHADEVRQTAAQQAG